MVRFTDDRIAAIAAWTPIEPGFDRGYATVEVLTAPIISRLSGNPGLSLRRMQDGGLSNYFSFLVFDARLERPPGGEARDVPCVVVMLSLITAVGVFGVSTFSEDERYFGYPVFEPGDVGDPSFPPDWISASVVAIVHESSPYRLVGRDVTDQLLPPGVHPDEYCFCSEPWSRVFHALFAATD